LLKFPLFLNFAFSFLFFFFFTSFCIFLFGLIDYPPIIIIIIITIYLFVWFFRFWWYFLWRTRDLSNYPTQYFFFFHSSLPHELCICVSCLRVLWCFSCMKRVNKSSGKCCVSCGHGSGECPNECLLLSLRTQPIIWLYSR
jgi:hypothetical protein